MSHFTHQQNPFGLQYCTSHCFLPFATTQKQLPGPQQTASTFLDTETPLVTLVISPSLFSINSKIIFTSYASVKFFDLVKSYKITNLLFVETDFFSAHST
jgi:hypothetical protein